MPPDHLFFAATAGAAADPARATGAWVLFLILAILLTMFFLGVALLTITHRLRNRREEPIDADNETLSDPWQEAGKRAEPFEESPRSNDSGG